MRKRFDLSVSFTAGLGNFLRRIGLDWIVTRSIIALGTTTAAPARFSPSSASTLQPCSPLPSFSLLSVALPVRR